MVVLKRSPHGAPPLSSGITTVRSCVLVPDAEQVELSAQSDRTQSTAHGVVRVSSGSHAAPPLSGGVTTVRSCVLVPVAEQVEVSAQSDRKQSTGQLMGLHVQLAGPLDPAGDVGQPTAQAGQNNNPGLAVSVTAILPGQ